MLKKKLADEIIDIQKLKKGEQLICIKEEPGFTVGEIYIVDYRTNIYGNPSSEKCVRDKDGVFMGELNPRLSCFRLFNNCVHTAKTYVEHLEERLTAVERTHQELLDILVEKHRRLDGIVDLISRAGSGQRRRLPTWEEEREENVKEGYVGAELAAEEAYMEEQRCMRALYERYERETGNLYNNWNR